MMNKIIGRIIRINGSKILVNVENKGLIKNVNVINLVSNYISIGSLVGSRLVDNRILIMSVDDIYDNIEIMINCTLCGIYDEVLNSFKFGSNSFPIINEKVFVLDSEIYQIIFNEKKINSYIGTYVYDRNVKVMYDPNIIFGKHLGVFGNTGSGKTCTVVSLIQNYIRNNNKSDIKFIILDVNGEYKTAFENDENEYIPFNKLKINHSILNYAEYGKLFKASDGVQYPALKETIEKLKKFDKYWDLNVLNKSLEEWVNPQQQKMDNYKNNLYGYMRSLFLRIDSICYDNELMSVINDHNSKNIIEIINETRKKVIIIDLQVSTDTLDIILFLLFKQLYLYKTSVNESNKTHFSLVLEEAHRYINSNVQETKLGSYYIDKLAREGRKFGIGLIISSQVPSLLSYEIVCQCNSVIMHKITSKRDLEYLKNILRISIDSLSLQMSSLEKQHAIVCGEAFSIDTLVRILDANPLPKSNDPIINKF